MIFEIAMIVCFVFYIFIKMVEVAILSDIKEHLEHIAFMAVTDNLLKVDPKFKKHARKAVEGVMLELIRRKQIKKPKKKKVKKK